MHNTDNQSIQAQRISAIPTSLLQQANNLTKVKLSDKSLRGKFILWGKPENVAFTEAILTTTGLTLPLQNGEVTEASAYRAIWANPNRWYLICEQQDEVALAKQLALSNQVHMSVTDGQCCFHLQGQQSLDVLKKGCSLNFGLETFPLGQCLQTRLAITKVFLHRHDINSFDIYVERSYSEYIWRWLLDAAKEY